MLITPALQIVTWCVLLTSLSILWLSGQLSPMLVAVGYTAVAVSAVRVRLEAKPWLSSGVWRWLTPAALTLFVVEWMVLGVDLLTASLHLLLYLTIYKLLTLERSRDYLHLYLIGFFQLLASTATTAELPYGVAFFCYVVLAPWTLMLYTLQLEAEQQSVTCPVPGGAGAGGAPGHPAVIRWPFFVMTTATAAGTFVLTVLIFFLIPRMGSGYMQSGGSAPANRIGFTERVELGMIGAVKLDPTVVMRVGVTSKAILSTAGVYWRGTAYDVYDGISWRKQATARVNLPHGGDGWFRPVSWPPGVQPDGQPVRQDVMLEPLETTVLFAAARPVAVSASFPALRMDGQGTLLLTNPPAGRIHYQVDSLPPRLAEADRRVTLADYGRIPLMYLQLPDGSERLTGLARSVAGAPAGPLPAAQVIAGLPVFETADRIERYLKQNYRYTLDVKAPGRLSAIDDFLFEQKAGYCEYYATAMVLMLRSVGVPARLASGFLSGEWNAFGSYFTVREQDAHTWVEVYFPQTGWFPFDPTPAAEGSPEMLGRVRQFIDTLWITWDRYIMRFSIRDQVSAWQEMQSQGSVWKGWSIHWIDAAKSGLKTAVAWVVRHRETWLLLIAIGCFGALVMRWWAQRHGGWPFWQAQALQATQRSGRTFYTKMLRLLAERGVRKPPTLTALEFVQVMGPELGPVAGAVETLTDYYHRLRFGASPLTDDEQRDVARLLRQIKG
ncbi:MAG: DUF3488 domain-containing protein [Nitrospirae bacterium]|nr:DUF3488 domain-containing protein [Nitrospirota bacterium]